MININSYKNKIIQCIYNNINLIFYIAAISTIGGGILHLLMVGPSLKPVNFPMQLLPYTDALFTISGILQIFWCIPIIKRWGINWYYIGLVGTIGLSLLLLMTRIPNGITNLPLEDKNPMGLLTEITQILFIGVTIIIIKSEYFISKLYRIKEPIKPYDELQKSRIDLDDEDYWVKERHSIIKQAVEDYTSRSYGKNNDIDIMKAESMNSKGVRLRKIGWDKEAIEYFEESLKIHPTYTKALYNKGVVLNKNGSKKEALELYNKAKEIAYK